jgi:hypothetical protein
VEVQGQPFQQVHAGGGRRGSGCASYRRLLTTAGSPEGVMQGFLFVFEEAWTCIGSLSKL